MRVVEVVPSSLLLPSPSPQRSHWEPKTGTKCRKKLFEGLLQTLTASTLRFICVRNSWMSYKLSKIFQLFNKLVEVCEWERERKRKKEISVLHQMNIQGWYQREGAGFVYIRHMVCGNRARDVNTEPRDSLLTDDQRFTLVPIPNREREKVKEKDPCTMITDLWTSGLQVVKSSVGEMWRSALKLARNNRVQHAPCTFRA